MRGKKKTEAKAEVQTVVYCGPKLPGIVMPWQAFINGVPPALSEAAEKNSFIKAMIVPLAKMQEVRQALHSKGGRWYTIYKKIEEMNK